MDGLRERKKAKVREEIAGAALRLFLVRGFESTTMDDIAAAAQVGRRTVFRYFATKEEVAFPDYAARLQRFEELLALRADAPPLRRVQDALRGLAADLICDRGSVLAWQRVVERSPALLAHERTLDLAWEAAIARALAAGVGHGVDRRVTDRRVMLCAGALFGVIRATLRLWIEGGAKDDLAALGEESLLLVERGLGHPEALPSLRDATRTRAKPNATPATPDQRPLRSSASKTAARARAPALARTTNPKGR